MIECARITRIARRRIVCHGIRENVVGLVVVLMIGRQPVREQIANLSLSFFEIAL